MIIIIALHRQTQQHNQATKTHLLADRGPRMAAALTDETAANPVAAETALSNNMAELKFILYKYSFCFLIECCMIFVRCIALERCANEAKYVVVIVAMLEPELLKRSSLVETELRC